MSVTSDYDKIGLKVGLEIHQQLASAEKLFCSCKTELFKGEPDFTFLRKLRPTQSELGQTDIAALFEFQKGIQILYEGSRETTCLVEMDEEPPHKLNQKALEATLIVSLLLNCKPIDRIHIMRKTVIDGSNTTGFQRTCVVALEGQLETKKRKIPIQHVGLEEDAARNVGQEKHTIRYRIDRLCIPLVEVATAPVIRTPQEAEDVALAIGRLLRATNVVKRGLGTIRQDLNISIQHGALVEVKGVQELELVSLIVENEAKRQLNLLKLRRDLIKHGAKEDDIKDEFVNVTDIFAGTKCKVISAAIEKDMQVLAAKLPRFEGFLKRELAPTMRLGKEMADRARFWGRVGGIFHTDELPSYGISQEEVDKVKQTMDVRPGDAAVLVADHFERTTYALEALNERAREALRGVPQETRAANPDGSTRFMRPRPGAARMYPETDVPAISITRDYTESIRRRLPELPEQRVQRLKQEYGLNDKLARQVFDSEYNVLFDEIIKECDIAPTTLAVTLTETMKALKREGVEVESVTQEQLFELFRLIGQKEAAKEGISGIIAWLSKHKDSEVVDALKALDLKMISKGQLEKVVDRLFNGHQNLLAEEKERAFEMLMGLVMREVRGKARIDWVTSIIKRKLAQHESKKK